MRTFIICNSKTGFTKRYAQWIAEETGGTILPYMGYSDAQISSGDLVIFGSRLHAGRIEHLDKIKRRFKSGLIVFAVGGVPGDVTEALEKIWTRNFSEEERARIPHFYMQGGVNYEKMGFIDRTMMKTAAKVMSRQQDKGFAKSIQSSYDISSREYIKPLVDYVKGKMNGFNLNAKRPLCGAYQSDAASGRSPREARP